MLDQLVLWDILINLTGLTGVVGYLLFLHSNRQRSPIEHRLLFLFWTLALLLAARTWFWFEGEPKRLQTFIFVPACMLPVVLVLTAEGLLRRHAPKLLKWLSAGSTVTFSAINLVCGMSDSTLIAFLLCLFCVLFWCVGLLLFRDQTTLSMAENRLVSSFWKAGLLSLPLAVSDFRFEIGFFPVRAGALGALILVYFAIRNSPTDGKSRRIVTELSKFFLRSAMLSVFVYLVADLNSERWAVAWTSFVAAATFVLQIMVFDAIGSLKRSANRNSLLRWLTDMPIRSKTAFINSMSTIPQLREMKILQGASLENYDDDILKVYFSQRPVVSLARLRTQRRDRNAAADQLADLLMTHQSTHVCLLSDSPMTLMVCVLPELESATFGETELKLLQRFAWMSLEKSTV